MVTIPSTVSSYCENLSITFEAQTKWKSGQKRETAGFTGKGEKENISLVYQFWPVKFSTFLPYVVELLPHSASEAESPDWEYVIGCTAIQVVLSRVTPDLLGGEPNHAQNTYFVYVETSQNCSLESLSLSFPSTIRLETVNTVQLFCGVILFHFYPFLHFPINISFAQGISKPNQTEYSQGGKLLKIRCWYLFFPQPVLHW